MMFVNLSLSVICDDKANLFGVIMSVLLINALMPTLASNGLHTRNVQLCEIKKNVECEHLSTCI